MNQKILNRLVLGVCGVLSLSSTAVLAQRGGPAPNPGWQYGGSTCGPLTNCPPPANNPSACSRGACRECCHLGVGVGFDARYLDNCLAFCDQAVFVY